MDGRLSPAAAAATQAWPGCEVRALAGPASLARQLNVAAAGPLATAAHAALVTLVDAHYHGGWGRRDAALDLYAQARRDLGTFLGAPAEQVSFQPSVSAIVSMVARSVDLAPGDEVLSWAAEYPSNLQAWHEHARKAGAELVCVTVPRGLPMDTALLAERVTPRTRVVTVSSVQSLDGAPSDLGMLRAACDRVGALLLVDASQHLGIAPFDFTASGADFAYAASHKWLLGPVGLALLAVRPRALRRVRTPAFGAGNYAEPIGASFDPGRSLRGGVARLEAGTPPLLAALATAAAARAIGAIGVERVQQQALVMRGVIAELFACHGWCALPGGFQPVSPIVAFDPPPRQLQVLSQELAARGVQFVVRGDVLRLAPWAMGPAECDEMCGLLDEALRAAR